MSTGAYILLIEDNPGDARLVRALFDEAPPGSLPALRWEQTAGAGVARLLSEPSCAAVLLDLGLPDCEGLQSLQQVRGHAEQVPVVVLSGNDDEEVGLAAVVAGAQDYLVKGSFDSAQLRRALQYATQRKRIERELVLRAMHDALTGLPTRPLLLDRLQMALGAASRSGHHGALLFVDLDRFKQVNDTHGHRAGDLVLKVTAERMRQAVRESDTVARVGGDEFIVLLPMIGQPDDGDAVAAKLLAALLQPVEVDGASLAVSASIGLVEFGAEPVSAEALIGRADQAMYVAKRDGRATVRTG
jgi:two-component system cell cycle response regulator